MPSPFDVTVDFFQRKARFRKEWTNIMTIQSFDLKAIFLQFLVDPVSHSFFPEAGKPVNQSTKEGISFLPKCIFCQRRS